VPRLRSYPTAATRADAALPKAGGGSVFPLQIDASGRYLKQANGTPFLIHGDTAWSICNQLDQAEVDTYLNDCQTRGFNTLVVELIERYATSQTPRHLNAYGEAPFSPMSPVDWATPVEAFWSHVDYIIDGCLARGIMVLAFPAYSGYPDRDEGWDDEYLAESDADLQAYGTFLGTRYTQGNIIWVGAGDKSITGAEQTKQLNIFSAIKAVQPAAIFSGHGTTSSRTREFWSATYTDLDLIYYWPVYGGWPYSFVQTSYDAAPVKPALWFEGQYEGSASAQTCRACAWQAVLSGSPGQVYGHSGLWAFSSPVIDATDWTTQLAATARAQMVHVKTLLTQYEWWKLVPQQNTSLVSSSLGADGSRVCPARASDGSFAMVYIPASQSVTVVMSALAPSSVRARLYDPTAGTFSAVSGSPFANTGTQSIASGGERVLVLDAA